MLVYLKVLDHRDRVNNFQPSKSNNLNNNENHYLFL
jgi:hypothetical protein